MKDKPTKPKKGQTEKRGKRQKEIIETGEYLREYRYDDYKNGIADAYTYIHRRLP